MVLFKNPNNASKFASLVHRMYPNRLAFTVDAYKDVMQEPYSYLLVNLRPEQDEELRLQMGIFPGDTHYI